MFICMHTCPKCHRDHSHQISDPCIAIDEYRVLCAACALKESQIIVGGTNGQGETTGRQQGRQAGMEESASDVEALPTGWDSSGAVTPALEKEDWASICASQVALEEAQSEYL
jgi:hypothetical protein